MELSDSALCVLACCAERQDRLTVKLGEDGDVVAGLIDKTLLEIETTDVVRQSMTVRLADAGRAELQNHAIWLARVFQSRRNRDAQVVPFLRREKSKRALLLSMLQAPEGATIEALIAASGWKRHSVRGFLARVGRDHEGYQVIAEMAGGYRSYRMISIP